MSSCRVFASRGGRNGRWPVRFLRRRWPVARCKSYKQASTKRGTGQKEVTMTRNQFAGPRPIACQSFPLDICYRFGHPGLTKPVPRRLSHNLRSAQGPICKDCLSIHVYPPLQRYRNMERCYFLSFLYMIQFKSTVQFNLMIQFNSTTRLKSSIRLKSTIRFAIACATNRGAKPLRMI